MAGVFDLQGDGVRAGLGGASAEKTFGGEGDAVGKIAIRNAPDERWSDSTRPQNQVEIQSCAERRKRVSRNRQWGLRGNDAAETNQDCKKRDDSGQDYQIGRASCRAIAEKRVLP